MILRAALLVFLAFAGHRFFLRRTKLPIHIAIAFAILGAAAVLVVRPELSDRLAHLVGVGRGLDLVTVLVEVFLLYTVVHYHTRFVEMRGEITALVRELALLRAERDEPRSGPSPALLRRGPGPP